MKYATCVTLACALLLPASNLTAQTAARSMVAAVAGCYALTLGPWQQPYLGGPQTLPPAVWLDTALAARVPVASDSVVSTLFVLDVRISGDTLFARVTVGVQWQCRGVPAVSSTSYVLIARWLRTAWEYRMREENALQGDPMPCMR